MDSLVFPDPSDCRACLDPRARKERTEMSEPWAHRDLLAPEDLRVTVELMVPKDLLVVWVPQEAMEKKERPVKRATQVHLESLAQGAPGEKWARRVKPDLREPPDQPGDVDLVATMDPRVTLDPLDSLETRAHPESLVLADWMVWEETKEMTESPVSRVLLVHLERLESQGHLVNGGQWDPQDKLASKVIRDPREKPEPRALWARLDRWDPRDLLGRPVLKACVVFLALLVNKVCLVLLVKTALQDLWVLPVCPA